MIPEESAKSFKIGTKKSGVDDVDYYVVKDKNGLKRWRKQGCWFVIYNINQESKKRYWYYPNSMFLGDWLHAGNGTTVPINKSWENVKYPLEEQFVGNPKSSTQFTLISVMPFSLRCRGMRYLSAIAIFSSSV